MFFLSIPYSVEHLEAGGRFIVDQIHVEAQLSRAVGHVDGLGRAHYIEHLQQ